MNMRLTIVAFLLIFTLSVLSQQHNFRNGFIISLDNDTITGIIDFRLDEEIMHSVSFIAEGEVNARQYFPGEITGYRLIDDGKFYVSKEIEIRKNQFRTVFVEFLVQGVKNLYFYTEDDNEYYLIDDEPGKLLVLSKEPDKIINNRFVEDIKYRSILKYVFREQENIYKKTDKTNYHRKDMINLTKDYHEKVCTDGSSCIVFENDYSKKYVSYQFAVYASMQLHWLELYTLYKRPDEDLMAMSVSPELGCQVSVFFPRFSHSLGLFSDLSLLRIQGVADYLYVNRELDRFNNRYEHKAYKINSMSGVKYVRDYGKIRSGVEAGLTLGYMFDQTNKLLIRKDAEPDSGTYLEFYNDFLPLSFRYGYVFAIQMDYKLQNANYIFMKVGCNRTYSFETVDQLLCFPCKLEIPNALELALQFKVGYIF